MNSQSQDDFSFSTLPSYAKEMLEGADSLEDASFVDDSNFDLGATPTLHSLKKTVQKLTEIWINERNAPDILPYERTLVEPLIMAIERQADRIMDKIETNSEDKFESMVFQTELERLKYLIKSYLRCRLWKIEKYTIYLLRRADLRELLSVQEIAYARRYQELVESHNHDSFLHQLPISQHKQDETTIGMSMVVEPNLDKPVFCRVLSDVGYVQIGNDQVLFEPNDIYMLRYRHVQQYLREGAVKLI